MNTRRDYSSKSTARQARRRNTVVSASNRNAKRQPKPARRAISGQPNVRLPFAPPEDWHEPTDRDDCLVIVQPPGSGYRHVVTADEIRAQLAVLPAEFTDQLEVVQLSTMTRKKQSFPCYGMQWGNAVYLYPLEENLVEYFYSPPRPALVTETKMFGGRWDDASTGVWTLTWTSETARDFYLNDVLIHELGHLVDERNSTYMDRERYAEWFAVEHGYRKTGGAATRRPGRKIRRRHHAV